MTLRSWAWTKCYDGVNIPRGAYIPTKNRRDVCATRGQHLCHHVLSVACSGFSTVADMKGNVGATRGLLCGRV
jgi:hypothetical protein